jgi:hypothetical protein
MSVYPGWVAPTTTVYCVRESVPRKHPRRPVVAGTDLCGPCHVAFVQNLTQIVDMWGNLQSAILRSTSGGDLSGVRAGGGHTDTTTSLWNPAATMVLRDITDWAGFLHRTIITERGDLDWSRWEYTETEDPRTTLATIVKWHCRWLSHHPALGASVAADAALYVFSIHRALQTTPVTRITLTGHHCQEVMRDTEFGPILCEGQLVGVLREAIDERPSAIMCANNPAHEIPASEWALIDV